MTPDVDLDALHAIFSEEAEELLAEMEEAVVALEGAPGDAETIATIFRVVHTLKGTANTVGLRAAGEFAHALEDLLQQIRDQESRVTRDAITLLLRSVDAMRALVEAGSGASEALPVSAALLIESLREALEAPGSDSPAVARAPSDAPRAAGDHDRTLRVGVGRLDRMVDLTGEIAIARGRLGRLVAALPEDSRTPVAELHEEVDRLETELQELVLQARMVAVGPTLRQLVRVARDVAAARGREVRVYLEGEDVEVDTTVVEHLRAPLTHMVRNAVDHGVEPPQIREAAGKPRAGRISVRARHHGGSVVVEVADDGAGLSRTRIAERARSIGRKPELLPDGELLQLVFEPGFSTARQVTETSGRGVGLDVVRRNVESVRGSVSIESREGRGATFTIRLPLTLAIIQGFHVAVGQERAVVPLDVITRCLELPEEHRDRSGRYGTLELMGKPLPFVRLLSQLSLPGRPAEREQVVVVRHEQDEIGLVVDRLEGESQTVVKPLGRPLAGVPGIAAATVLGDGRVGLILDVPGLMSQVRRYETQRDHAAAREEEK